jgi:hypothetical protein
MFRITMLACVTAAGMAATGLGGAARAGAIDGPKVVDMRVPALGTAYYDIVCHGGRLAEVLVDGDGDTDLDLYVYDELGNLVDYDDDLTDTCYGTWVPWRTARFTIKIVNRGRVFNDARLLVR